MTTLPQPPPEALLIARLREAPPRLSIRKAAEMAGISDARWRQIEHGVRYFRGEPHPERGPAQAVAKMAHVVGATPEELTEAQRPDAAGELSAILAALTTTSAFSERQRDALTRRVKRDIPGR